VIFGAVLIAYAPALRGGFIWDDSGHVTRRDLQPWSGLGRIWFEMGATQQYYPVLHTAFWVEHRLWGDSPLGYHLLNVLLHGTAACLVGVLLRRLAIPGAWFAALLFALHPVGVESVAWIAEQKNTLSTVLYLCAALAYLRFGERRTGRAYAVATACFLLALLTKTVTATLPAALLVVFWWRRGRLEFGRDVRPLLPWFACGTAAGALTAWVERTLIGAHGADFTLSFVQRGLLAGRVVWFYLGKLFWPADLVFIYPRWTIDAAAAWQYVFPAAALTLAVGLVWWRRRAPGPPSRAATAALVALLFYVGSLFPALGFVNVYPFIYSYVADHFQYLASIGILALAAAGGTVLTARLPRGPAVAAGMAAFLLVWLGSLTRRQSEMYRDVFVLYQTTIDRNPTCSMAHNNLAEALANAGRRSEAIPHLQEALRLRPDMAEAENNLGDDLRALGRPQEGIPHLQRAIALRPIYAEAHNNLGIAFVMTGRLTDGVAEFQTALRLKPIYPVAHYNLGLALADSDKAVEAIDEFAAAVRQDPDYADAELGWAIGLTVTGRIPDAIPHYERALKLAPDSPEAHVTYGRALATAGRLGPAIDQYEQALQLAPESADAHLNLALALRQAGRVQEADAHYREAMRLKAAGASGQN
jgi:tetratricopeptide (TPR) repeat protein